MPSDDLRERLDRCEALITFLAAKVGPLSEREFSNFLLHRESYDPMFWPYGMFSSFGRMRDESLARYVELKDEGKQLREEVHTYMVAQSMGLDLSQVPLPRFIPVRVYLSEAADDDVRQITAAVEGVTDAFGFQVADEFPAQSGSWWKKWIAKSTEAVTQPEVQERLAELERALKMKGLMEPQAEIDRKQAEAVALLIKATENSKHVAIQSGSILFVKTTIRRKEILQARTLTQKEMIHLEQHQELFTSPATILSELASLSRSAEGPERRRTFLPEKKPEARLENRIRE